MTQNLADIDRYIVEAIRVRRSIQVYDELYCSHESVEILLDKAGRVFGVLQRALHDEIVISLSRLFDSLGYDTKGGRQDYLSQLNIVNANESILTENEQELRKRTAVLWEEIDIKSYRNLKIAHNDKESLVVPDKIVKHGVSTEKAKELVDVSIQLMICIKRNFTGSEEVSLPQNPNDKYEGYARELVGRLKKI
ncbi:hypothetical protein [Methylophaga thalassica]|uniref:AbiU2 domain-containing protein n=1 Tax=Methylophaga thalassica TaxID=40223 RepID=UPI002E7B22A3|nr:hypothetical protein [Methylophaga thalassica]WVI84626.1 hypothetical protein VSX76_12695 [Methylophaga thalassica]